MNPKACSSWSALAIVVGDFHPRCLSVDNVHEMLPLFDPLTADRIAMNSD
jgi:hypothetical protein